MDEEGLRERKRRETRTRIAETALKLFLTNGYEETTLDEIAEQAGISRRTFFSYFDSKEEVVLAWQAASYEGLLREILKTSPDEHPLDAIRDALIRDISKYKTDEMIALDRLLRSSETLRTRKQAGYARQEESLFATLCEVWRQPERRPGLRLIAMVATGAIRLAIETWSAEGGKRSPEVIVKETFQRLRSEI